MLEYQQFLSLSSFLCASPPTSRATGGPGSSFDCETIFWFREVASSLDKDSAMCGWNHKFRSRIFIDETCYSLSLSRKMVDFLASSNRNMQISTVASSHKSICKWGHESDIITERCVIYDCELLNFMWMMQPLRSPSSLRFCLKNKSPNPLFHHHFSFSDLKNDFGPIPNFQRSPWRSTRTPRQAETSTSPRIAPWVDQWPGWSLCHGKWPVRKGDVRFLYIVLCKYVSIYISISIYLYLSIYIYKYKCSMYLFAHTLCICICIRICICICNMYMYMYTYTYMYMYIYIYIYIYMCMYMYYIYIHIYI